ncbi:hypothetical protein BOH78_2767 [Pichia kudriavzevii]|uniref:Uncharacterized protein n=1 Tax=Pichia kudriavzevii TaxID=4909 RepID=A0A1V2LML2_PICKU|nr:hypothetical protein BOH78_2767 [Pichia kudriavzevii]
MVLWWTHAHPQDYELVYVLEVGYVRNHHYFGKLD